MSDGGILQFDTNLLIGIGIQMFNIALLTGILIKLLYKPVKKFMADRQARIHDEIQSSHELKQEAMELKEKYESMLANVDQEREEILAQAHKKAMEKSDQLLVEARREADAVFERGMAELKLEQKNAKVEMKEQMIEIATLMAGHFVQAVIDKETQDRLIDEAFADWKREAC